MNKLLLYCTKNRPYLIGRKAGLYKYYLDNGGKNSIMDGRDYIHNGKIVCECDFKVETIERKNTIGDWFQYINQDEIMKKACIIDPYKFFNYLGGKNGYAIHLKNIEVFDEPKELIDYYSIHNVGGMILTDKLKKAPQNMQRISIKEWEYGTYNPNDIAILISIHPKWLCKILNSEKNIEIRKKILKGMLKNE